MELKRRVVEEASNAVCDALKVQRQEGFKVAAREAGLFASKHMMLMVAREAEAEAEAEADADAEASSYTPVLPSYTPVSPSSYTLWGLQEEEEDEDEEGLTAASEG